MHLGRLIAGLSDEAVALETLVGLADLPLMVAVQTVGASFGESPAIYAAGAVGRFAALADDADWLALMTAVERADDPAAAGLRRILTWSLHQDQVHNEECSSCRG